MPIIYSADSKKRKNMNELNQILEENLSVFLLGFREEVVRALLEYSELEE